MSNKLKTELKSILSRKLPRDKNFLYKKREGVVNIRSLKTALDQYANKGLTISIPKLDIIVARPKSEAIREAIVDIRAKANILPTSLARALGCLILRT